MGCRCNRQPLPQIKAHSYSVTKTTLQESISARLAACREVVYALRTAANAAGGLDRLELLALAHRIHLCGLGANAFVCEDAINMNTGEIYQAKGVMWRCGSKLCPNCISIFAAKHRRQLRTQIKRVTLGPKEKWHFGTMTIPNPNLSLLATRHILQHAWSLYRKRLLSLSSIRGGCKSEEFTLTANGYHYHLHTLFISEYVHYQEVRRVWTECVAKSFKVNKVPHLWQDYLRRRAKQNAEWNEANPDEKPRTDMLLRVVIKPVTNLEQVVNEVCKYLTKSDSWYKMPSEHLAEVGLIRRWWRMFELHGCMRAEKRSLTSSTTQDEVSESIVHTSSLSDGVATAHQILSDIMKPDRAEAWREIQARMSFEEYVRYVNDHWIRGIQFRQAQIRHRWPGSKLFYADELGNLFPVAADEREQRATLATVLRNLQVNVELD